MKFVLYRLSDVDEADEYRMASSQTDLATCGDGCSNWTLSCRGQSDDDGYDVIVDDSDDNSDAFDDSFAMRVVSGVLTLLLQKLIMF